MAASAGSGGGSGSNRTPRVEIANDGGPRATWHDDIFYCDFTLWNADTCEAFVCRSSANIYFEDVAMCISMKSCGSCLGVYLRHVR